MESQIPKGVCPECGSDWRPYFEASDITRALPKLKKRLSRILNVILFVFLGIGFLIQRFTESQENSHIFETAFGVSVLFMIPLLVAAHVIGESKIERRISKEAGVFCLDCGRSPNSSDLPDWISCNHCLECNGHLHRDFSDLSYKDDWPEWREHECG